MLVNPREKDRVDASTPILTFVIVLVLLWMLSALLHQQYDLGYANGLNDGMMIGEKSGDMQGQYEAIVNLQQWEYQHGCAVQDDYVSLRITRDAQGKATYTCKGKP